MVELFADFLLSAKALKEAQVSFNLRMRNFDGYGAARMQIDTTEDRCGVGVRNKTFDGVVIELVANLRGELHPV